MEGKGKKKFVTENVCLTTVCLLPLFSDLDHVKIGHWLKRRCFAVVFFRSQSYVWVAQYVGTCPFYREMPSFTPDVT